MNKIAIAAEILNLQCGKFTYYVMYIITLVNL
jgi:hypothetical protein